MSGIAPVIHVDDCARSLAFYARLGFELVESLEADRRTAWALIRNGQAELMVESTDKLIDPHSQGVFLYLFTPDVVGLYERLKADGLEVGQLHNPPYMRGGEFRLVDPDGYVVLIGQPKS
jgi:catechol 2,3-dioxygenase-like lactoylglutathione lyase family enzyme